MHFYLAMCHDSLAREKTVVSLARLPELELAEEHYLATIETLIAPRSVSRIGSVMANVEVENKDASSRRSSDVSSVHSTNSSAGSNMTAATSVVGDVLDCPSPNNTITSPPHRLTNVLGVVHPYSESSKDEQSQVESNYPVQRHAQFKSFLDMVRSHLASVRELKNAPVPTPFPIPLHRGVRARPQTRASSKSRDPKDWLDDENETGKMRERRKNMVFRKRFDPRAIQELCDQALAEL